MSSPWPVASVKVIRDAGKGELSQSIGSAGGTLWSTIKCPSISKLPTVLSANAIGSLAVAATVKRRKSAAKLEMWRATQPLAFAASRQYFGILSQVAIIPSLIWAKRATRKYSTQKLRCFSPRKELFCKVLNSKRHNNQKFSMKRSGIEKKMNE